MSSAAPALEVLGVSKSLGSRLVLDDVRFSIPRGRIACLLGPNGSGKTTLLKILSTLILPDSGTASILGRDLLREPREVLRLIGLHGSEERSFYGRLSPRENLRFFGALYGLAGPPAEERIRTVARTLRMETFLDKRYQELSTGMKDRVQLARALLHDPPLVFLDEPTTGLDPVAAERFLDEVLLPLAHRDGKMVLMATHHLEETRRVADQVLVLSRGRLAMDADRPAFLRRAESGGMLEYLKSLEREGSEAA